MSMRTKICVLEVVYIYIFNIGPVSVASDLVVHLLHDLVEHVLLLRVIVHGLYEVVLLVRKPMPLPPVDVYFLHHKFHFNIILSLSLSLSLYVCLIYIYTYTYIFVYMYAHQRTYLWM